VIGHPHVLLGIFLDRHSCIVDDEKRPDVSPFLSITASGFWQYREYFL
jgi:hypothetical protein